MAQFENRRIRPDVLQADREALIAVQNMTGYSPINIAYSVPNLVNAITALEAARNAEINAQNALNAARDAVIAAEWAFHNAILGTKDQVVAQYGADSDEVQAMGLKKKSDRKRPMRRVEMSGRPVAADA